MDNQDKSPRLLILLLAAAGILLLGLIIFFKHKSDRPLPDPDADSVYQSTHGPIAVPDTTLDETLLPQTTDTTYSLPADSVLGRDSRPASEAGYEDGYIDGMDDGADGKKGQRYNTDNAFSSPTDIKAYQTSYKEGYAKGFDDAQNHRQFGI